MAYFYLRWQKDTETKETKYDGIKYEGDPQPLGRVVEQCTKNCVNGGEIFATTTFSLQLLNLIGNSIKTSECLV
jgi:hypothetical protein